MNKNDVLEFTKNSAEKEQQIQKITNEKIYEFMNYQKKILNDIQSMIKDYFPEEIKKLVAEYIEDNQRVIAIDNYLWLDLPVGEHIRIQLNPNHFCGVSFMEDCTGTAGKLFPKNIKELENNYKQFQNYSLLKTALEDSIEPIYKLLCDWKEEKLNKELEFLSSLPFSNFPIPQTQEKYKVTIIIEKI